MTTTLSADDVRRQVTEAWCQTCQQLWHEPPLDSLSCNHRGVECLWSRCPGCQPEGLEWDNDQGAWLLSALPEHGTVHRFWIAPSHAIDLILMATARDGATAYSMSMCAADSVAKREPLEAVYVKFLGAVMSGDLPGTTKWRHRLKDLEDKA